VRVAGDDVGVGVPAGSQHLLDQLTGRDGIQQRTERRQFGVGDLDGQVQAEVGQNDVRAGLAEGERARRPRLARLGSARRMQLADEHQLDRLAPGLGDGHLATHQPLLAAHAQLVDLAVDERETAVDELGNVRQQGRLESLRAHRRRQPVGQLGERCQGIGRVGGRQHDGLPPLPPP
jgi:hypothetical protein